MDTVARAWLAYHLSGSGTTLGLVSLARGLPQVVVLLVSGAIADRVDKRRILVISQASLAALGLINAWLVHVDVIQIWHLSVIGLLQGAIFALNGPTRHALVPSLVSAEQLPSAIAITNTALHTNGVLAPVVAGILIANSPDLAFFAIAIAYAGAALTLFGASKTRARGRRARRRVAHRANDRRVPLSRRTPADSDPDHHRVRPDRDRNAVSESAADLSAGRPARRTV